MNRAKHYDPKLKNDKDELVVTKADEEVRKEVERQAAFLKVKGMVDADKGST